MYLEMIKKDLLKKLFILSSVFFYFINTKFSFLPVYTYQIVIIGLVLYFIYNRKDFYIDKALGKFILAYFFVLSYILFNYIVNGYSDITLFKTWIVFLVKSTIGIYLLSLLFNKNDFSFHKMIFYLQVAIFIHACLMLIYFFNIDFKEWTIQYIPSTGGNIDPAVSHRSRGIVGSSGATLALLQSFGLLFTAYLLSMGKVNKIKILYYTISLIVILGSIIVSGRTGLLMVPMIFMYMIVLYFWKRESSILMFKYFSALIILGIAFIASYIYLNDIVMTDNLRFIKMWFSNEIQIKDGSISILTLEILSKHWLFPNDLLSWFLGTTDTWKVNRIATDIGYFRILNALGIIGSLIFYGFFLWVFIVSIKRFNDPRNKALLITIGTLLFITEYKEPFFGKVMISSIVSMLYFSSAMLKEKSE